ncbi:retrovirus-related pol polyprotein from transposon TNT 1-94 [Tanacetum coccineum]|uniref:Retrovirus-related pol polyprotein from transposon TNT 1-94 n=1 Tax=Tanacetum coccineum TaxID=301880 RepID=A0ABQ5E5Y6_9ASTR
MLSEQVPGNIIKALGGKGRRKEKISSKEEPLPPLPKLIGAALSGTSESIISLSNLTLNMADLTLDTLIPRKTRPSVKVSPAYVMKKKIEKSPTNFSFPCTPKQNSVAERRNRTLIEAARTMLNSVKLPKQFWGEAVNTACYIKLIHHYEKAWLRHSYDRVLTRKIHDISFFHVFGCHVHIHNHKDHLGKFNEKANDGFFLGYSLVDKTFRCSTSKDKKWKKQYMLHSVKMMKSFLNPAQKVMQSTLMKTNPFQMMNYLNQRVKLLNALAILNPLKFTKADNHPALNEPDQTESADHFNLVEPQNNTWDLNPGDVQPSPTILSHPAKEETRGVNKNGYHHNTWCLYREY